MKTGIELVKIIYKKFKEGRAAGSIGNHFNVLCHFRANDFKGESNEESSTGAFNRKGKNTVTQNLFNRF